jgi:hypothetical protein
VEYIAFTSSRLVSRAQLKFWKRFSYGSAGFKSTVVECISRTCIEFPNSLSYGKRHYKCGRAQLNAYFVTGPLKLKTSVENFRYVILAKNCPLLLAVMSVFLPILKI